MTASGPESYESLAPLSAVYLEDSYVLGIESDDRCLRFDMDLVLTPSHPAYHKPREDEEYCYRRGVITVEHVASVRWIRRVMQVFRDATGSTDYGSIDAWQVLGETHHIEGDWGEVLVQGGHVKLALLPDEPSVEGR